MPAPTGCKPKQTPLKSFPTWIQSSLFYTNFQLTQSRYSVFYHDHDSADNVASASDDPKALAIDKSRR